MQKLFNVCLDEWFEPLFVHQIVTEKYFYNVTFITYFICVGPCPCPPCPPCPPCAPCPPFPSCPSCHPWVFLIVVSLPRVRAWIATVTLSAAIITNRTRTPEVLGWLEHMVIGHWPMINSAMVRCGVLVSWVEKVRCVVVKCGGWRPFSLLTQLGDRSMAMAWHGMGLQWSENAWCKANGHEI